MPRPVLIVVSGAPASGKTTLAHLLAKRMPCPVISRDEIKEGIVHTEGGITPQWGGEISQRTYRTFFATIRLLLEAGTTLVAEAAFQHELWAPDLQGFLEIADARVVHCHVDAKLARERIVRRSSEQAVTRASHPDEQLLAALDSGEMRLEEFDRVSVDAPAIEVDTTDGYSPSLDEIVVFAKRR